MDQPDQRLFEADLASADFRISAAKGLWGQAEAELLPMDMKWPRVILWIAAGARTGAPERFYVSLDAAGYNVVPPTGTFWDPGTKQTLEFGKRPKGRQDSRFAKIFRTDWKDGAAFYHPYDRVAATDHPQWRTDQPHLVWTSSHTIVDYLEEFHSLLNCGDYLGV